MGVIRFVYPNFIDDHFHGGVRLTAQKNVEPIKFNCPYKSFKILKLMDEDGTLKNDNAEIADKYISDEHFERPIIHEYKDEDYYGYFGDSSQLAKLLVLINCAIPLKNKIHSMGEMDIWCTGGVKLIFRFGSFICTSIKTVDSELFAKKLEAFTKSSDNIFLVPQANINDPSIVASIQQNNIAILSLKQFISKPPNKRFLTKTIIKLKPYELTKLLWLFYDLPEIKRIKKTLSILIVSACLFCIPIFTCYILSTKIFDCPKKFMHICSKEWITYNKKMEVNFNKSQEKINIFTYQKMKTGIGFLALRNNKTKKVMNDIQGKILQLTIQGAENCDLDMNKLFKFQVNDNPIKPLEKDRINTQSDEFYIFSGNGTVHFRIPNLTINKIEFVFWNCSLNNLSLFSKIIDSKIVNIGDLK